MTDDSGLPSSDELLRRPFAGQLADFVARADAKAAFSSRTFGPYRIERLLGRGGMGAVYLASDAAGDRVALKIARPDRAADEHLNARLRNEARALAAVAHDNVVRLVDSGEIDGTFYVATEFHDGLDLLDWCRRHQPDPRTILNMAAELAAALQACHQHHVVHRDLSPRNVIVTPRGHLVLVDFGLGFDLREETPRITKTGHVAGTLGYLPPECREVARPGAVSPQWDVYAFGACLYAMWARRDFDPQKLHELYPSLGSGEDLFTRKLKLIARKCLARDPRFRFADAAGLRAALQRAANPPPAWRSAVLVGASAILTVGLFGLAQVGGTDPGLATGGPIRSWSHALHFGLVALFFLRSWFTRNHPDYRLELCRFMPAVWATFMGYYAFNAATAALGLSGPLVAVADAAISNANGASLLLAFCALWMATRRGDPRSVRYRHTRTGILVTWIVLLGVATYGSATATTQELTLLTVQLPCALFVGVGLCALAIGLGQKALQTPPLALLLLILYGLVQLLYPAFAWIAAQSEGLMIATYGFGMIGKLALFLGVERAVRSWSLFGYEGQLSNAW